MALMRPKVKSLLNLLLGLALLGTLFFIWYRLELVYNRPDGKPPAVVWKRDRGGPIASDLSKEEGMLRHNLGNIDSSRIFMGVPTGDKRTYFIFLGLLGGWGLVQVYLAYYYFGVKAK